jgi:ribosomal protein S18 acetylase RimI-like enzyme
VDALDNPVWHTLAGVHAGLAEGDERARRYRPDVIPLGAVPDDAGDEHWEALAALAGGAPLGTYRREVAPPAGWTVLSAAPAGQMVRRRAAPPATTELPVVELGPADAEHMVELAETSGLGPFLPGAVRLGTWLGIREGGELVAMAGQRLAPPGHVEVATVCTRPRVAGRGYGTALTEVLSARILGAGAVPILHVFTTNTGATRLYERLGFVERMVGTFAVLQGPTP